MKKLLVIFIFSFLFGQNVLTTKGGKTAKGKVVKIVGTTVYFERENVKGTLKIPIRSIKDIVDKDGNPSSVLNSTEYKNALDQALSLIKILGNKSSMLYHRGDVKHLPPKDGKELFSTVEEAQSNGYKPCLACFDMRPALDDYYLEKSLVQGVNGSIRTRWEIEYDHPKLEKIETILNNTLDNWTETLKGYKYRVQIIVDEDPNAFAVAGGNLYFSTGLLDLIENDSELEFVIAHEVAHIERRHTLRQFKEQQKKALQGAIAAALFGVGVYAAGGDAQSVATATSLSAMMVEYSNVYLMKGYGRDLEQEADIFAQLQFQSGRISKEKMTYILDKLSNHAKTMGNNITVNAFSDHPSLDGRMSQIKGSEFIQLEKSKTIIVVPEGKGYKSDPIINISTDLIYHCPSSNKKGNMIITLLGKMKNPHKDKSYRIDKLTIKASSLKNPVSLKNLEGTSISKNSEMEFVTTIDLKKKEGEQFIKSFTEGSIDPEVKLSAVTIKKGEGAKKKKNTYINVATFFK